MYLPFYGRKTLGFSPWSIKHAQLCKQSLLTKQPGNGLQAQLQIPYPDFVKWLGVLRYCCSAGIIRGTEETGRFLRKEREVS